MISFEIPGYFFNSERINKDKPENMKPALSLLVLCFLFSCQNNNGDQKESVVNLTDSTSVTGLTGDSVKLVKTASINFKVKDATQSTRAVSGLAQKYGGMLTYQSIEAVELAQRSLKVSSDSVLVITAATPHADITARIPSQHLEAFLFDVADLGYYTGSSKLQVDDKSLAYLENSLKQKNRTNALSRTPTGKTKAAAIRQAITIRDETIEQQMANKAIDADVQYSTINLALSQNPLVRKEMVANTNMDDYQLSYGPRFRNAVADGWNAFLDFVLLLTQLWMFILFGLAIFFTYKVWQKRSRPAGL